MYRLSTIIRVIVDVIFPPSSDALLVRDAKPHELTMLMKKTYVHDTLTLLPFRILLVRAAIHEAKFHGSGSAFTLLGNALHEHLVTLPTHEHILIPIPLSGSRKRQRGYNQASEIAKVAVAGLPHIKIREDILKRTRNTTPQTKLVKEERLLNMENAFAVVHPDAITGTHIILLDDVVTTGATLDAAKASLLQHSPASVTVIALAH